ncbi:ubiquitin carboxyl-terminal hydrolase puf [Eurytemora carolleeae]|uniref:ubiquitin carboxyl-terminal hydrolase puf n=1 Tax=Eurytemora carolleeae TaxID=1294199 RepID=UPI000C7775D6|nr:ubiquitin carboxyl-terminal hydrolase puf [Eurytemora carolleeae]|eukprot:XP_023333698.1 ubiquitin carboxyl-terminal hydrolase puf-like [Eurytemora affinis]
MCDNCSDFQLLLLRIERSAETTNSDNEGEGEIELTGQDVNISLNFINTWHQKQCMCIFRDVKNIERFSTLVQTITKLALVRLKQLPALLLPEGDGEVEPRPPDPVQGYIEEAEILVTYLSRMFMLQFPLYLAAKQAGSRLEDLNHAEATSLAVFLDVAGQRFHIDNVEVTSLAVFLDVADQRFNINHVEVTSLAVFLDVAGDIADIPLVLLQNVAKFCRTGGLLAMTNILNLPPAVLPHSFAHGLVSILCNLKLWLNPRALSQLFSPYLCKLSDLELRQQHSRAMADFLWSCNKDNIDSPPVLDKEGLELAFKYFSSPTLTIRSLPSIINRFVKVHDLISPLIKNLEAGPVLHLLTLLKTLPLKEHTEQTIYLAQVVQKFIWSKGSVFPLLPDTQPGRRGSRASTGSETQRRFLQSGRRSSRDSIGSDQGRRFLQSGRRSSRDSTGSDQDRRFIENQRKRSCTESSEDMDIQELAELDDEQDELDELDDGDEFSEDDDELVSSSDPDSDSGRTPRHKPTHPDVDDDDQLDQSVDLDSPPPRSRVHLKPPSSPLDRPRGPTSRSRSPISRVSGPFRITRIKPGNKQELQRKVSLEDEEEEDDVEDNEILEEEEEEENLENTKDSDKEDDKENEEKVEKDKDGKEENDVDIVNKEISLKRSREPSDKISGEFEFSSEGGNPGPGPSRGEIGPGPRGDPRAKKARIVRKLSEAEQLPPPVNCSGTWGTTWDDGGQGAVMNELANLVGAGEDGRREAERSGGRGREGGRGKDRVGGRRDRGHRLTDIYASQYVRNYRQDSRYKNEVDTSGEGSDDDEGGIQGYRDPETSSHNSAKSEKNLEDFVDEDESCEEELARLAQVEQLGSILQQQQLAQMAQLYQSRLNSERMHNRCESVWLIMMVFIEGCLKNLENNKSVVVSLKLIPKLIQSFHNFPGSDTHEMTMYIERTHNMSQLFFNNLKVYTRGPRREGFYPPATEIQVRLHFLAVIFSICLSPDTFRFG